MFGLFHRGRRRGATAATPAITRLASILAFATLASVAACDAASPPGELHFAIAADTCAAYCITAVRVTLYEEGDDLPLGPPLQASCASADALVFTTLPAGLRVEAAVEGFDLTGDTLLTGRSAPVTIAASRQTDLTVALSAMARPTITSAEPDPIAPSLTPTLTVLGEHLGPLGDHGLLLDDQQLAATFTPATDDGPDQVTASLAAVTGSSLIARRCGVDSIPFPLRVATTTPGSAAVTGLPLCGGAPVAFSHAAPHTVIAWRCDASSSSQIVVMTDGDAGSVCPLDPAGAWPLGAAPTGPLVITPSSTSTPSAAWVALSDAVARIDLTTGTTTSFPVIASSLAMTTTTTTSTTTWAIANGLVELHDDGTTTPRPDLFPELDFVALASAPSSTTSRLWVAATATGTGQGRLVSIPESATPTAYPIPCAPTAIATSDATVALACADALVLWDVASSTPSTLDLSSSALAIPTDAPDTLFALTADGLTLVDLAPSPTIVLTTSMSADAVAALGSNRLLTRDAAALRVLTPYDARGPCP